MAKPRYPSEKLDQYMLRLPDGMRDRIKAAAETNSRSMNAEIVARLEKTFGSPINSPGRSGLDPLYVASYLSGIASYFSGESRQVFDRTILALDLIFGDFDPGELSPDHLTARAAIRKDMLPGDRVRTHPRMRAYERRNSKHITVAEVAALLEEALDRPPYDPNSSDFDPKKRAQLEDAANAFSSWAKDEPDKVLSSENLLPIAADEQASSENETTDEPEE